ncbi:DNA-3-methyladenine glycosylase I [Psychromicrobium lacuslunae]|uniref:3-methyladenine DNA glycosylase n=1 Tax=Psychromicrobium lacuslunae TaxID=1618207 RepID=A0A0D4BZ07_9MICC|nr:DNA-3-methyladenine glycosylase I [Psychromicrobium lacuslunae]AJT41558.1 3-methyladenine DNA glycosylase [Psychromicrobium lacuslunae]
MNDPVSAEKSAAPDQKIRCAWPGLQGSELYQNYHDFEWGRPVHGEHELFERLSLEAFQSGLSWLTILRKREAFRAAFADFDPAKVAVFDAADVNRLMNDAGIVRNTLKINATINNAQAILNLPNGVTLGSLLQDHRPAPRPAGTPVPASTLESAALAKRLKKLGFRFVGPTTSYAMMQAIGLVNDHQEDCWVRAEL